MRAVLVTIAAVGTVSCMPRLVWESEGRQLRLACALTLGALNLANVAFNVLQQAAVRTLLALGIGVPVPRFDDFRWCDDSSMRGHDGAKPSNEAAVAVGAGVVSAQRVAMHAASSPPARRRLRRSPARTARG